MKIKIHYENCEEKGEVGLEVKCPHSELKAVENFITEFMEKNPFYTGAKNFIDYLKKFGFEAKEIEYDLEIY